jgi:hypothetical protein
MRAAAILVVVGAACQSRPVVHQPSPSQQAADRALLYRLDHVLATYRLPMCAELDRELPTIAIERRRSIEAMTSACDGRDAASCFELGRLWESAGTDRSEEIHDQRPDLERFYGRACDLGSDDGCRALSQVFYFERKDQPRLALAFALLHAGRIEVCAEIWPALHTAERSAFAPSLPALRAKLDVACTAGDARACEARAGLESDPDASWQPGPFDPKQRPWLIKACLAGSVNACGWTLDAFDPAAVDRTEAIVARACHGPTCDGLVAALRDSCRAGVWSSCYLAADACTSGGSVPPPTQPATSDVIFVPAEPPAHKVD